MARGHYKISRENCHINEKCQVKESGRQAENLSPISEHSYDSDYNIKDPSSESNGSESEYDLSEIRVIAKKILVEKEKSSTVGKDQRKILAKINSKNKIGKGHNSKADRSGIISQLGQSQTPTGETISPPGQWQTENINTNPESNITTTIPPFQIQHNKSTRSLSNCIADTHVTSGRTKGTMRGQNSKADRNETISQQAPMTETENIITTPESNITTAFPPFQIQHTNTKSMRSVSNFIPDIDTHVSSGRAKGTMRGTISLFGPNQQLNDNGKSRDYNVRANITDPNHDVNPDIFENEDLLLASPEYQKKRKCTTRKFNPDWIIQNGWWWIKVVEAKDSEKLLKIDRVECIVCKWKTLQDESFQARKYNIDRHSKQVNHKKAMEQFYEAESRGEVKKGDGVIIFTNDPTLILTSQNEKDPEFEKIMRVKKIQFAAIFLLLKYGRPMTALEESRILLKMAETPNLPEAHWSKGASWDIGDCLAEVEREKLRIKLSNCNFFAISLDEVTAIDTTSWVCFHVYIIENLVRVPYLLNIVKMSGTRADDIYNVLVNSLKEIGSLSEDQIASKLICITADGASVMQGVGIGVCTQVRQKLAPFCIQMACMSHRLNLACRRLNEFAFIKNVEEMNRDLHLHFTYSCKQVRQFQEFCLVESGEVGLKPKRVIETRWNSLLGPCKRLVREYFNLLGYFKRAMLENFQKEERRKNMDFYTQLSDIENLLTLSAIIPLLVELDTLIKSSQDRTMTMMQFNSMRLATLGKIEEMYNDLSQVNENCDEFKSCNWEIFLNFSKDSENNKFLGLDEMGNVCWKLNSTMYPMMWNCANIDIEKYKTVILMVSGNMTKAATFITKCIYERFPNVELFEAFDVISPFYYQIEEGRRRVCEEKRENFQLDPIFREKTGMFMRRICDHFAEPKNRESDGKSFNGVLNRGDIRLGVKQFLDFSLINSQKAIEEAASKESSEDPILEFWKNAERILPNNLKTSEWFKLYELINCLVISSAEDERLFSALSYVKNKFRNKLDTNLEVALRLRVSKCMAVEFPYKQAISNWIGKEKRRMATSVQTSPDQQQLSSMDDEMGNKENRFGADGDSSFILDF